MTGGEGRGWASKSSVLLTPNTTLSEKVAFGVSETLLAEIKPVAKTQHRKKVVQCDGVREPVPFGDSWFCGMVVRYFHFGSDANMC